MAVEVLHIEAAGVVLQAERAIPAQADGMVLVCDGIRRARLSRRHRRLADICGQAGLATLLLDVITEIEASLDLVTAWHRLDADLIAGRLVAITDWVSWHAQTAHLPVGVAATGGAVGPALLAATHRPSVIRAVVGWDGRPNLSAATLGQVTAPTLLIAEPADELAANLNEYTAVHINAPCKFHTTTTSAPNAVESVAAAASDWFTEHLHPNGTSSGQSCM